MGSRLHPFKYAKELLPVVFLADGPGKQARPILAAEYSLEAMRIAGIHQYFIVISPWKTEILRCFGDGKDRGVSIAYLHQATPRGLADAVDAAYDWCQDYHVGLALPDSVFHPQNAFAVICSEIKATNADLVLGVFPTKEPEHLGPVRIGDGGIVLEVLDKPTKTELRNTWGIAVWSPRFTDLLHRKLQNESGALEKPLGIFFNQAASEGLNVRAVLFPDGAYCDVGRPETIASLVLREWPHPGVP